MGRPPGEGEEPSQKRARSGQHEGADEVIVEGITFVASARPHNWRSKCSPDAGAGGAWSEPKETASPPVKLRMTGISRDKVPAIAKKAVVRNYPSWACVECTYRHELVNGEASLRKCAMCGTPRPIRRPRGFRKVRVEPAVSSAAAQPPPSFLSNAASIVPRVCAPPPLRFLTNPPPKRFPAAWLTRFIPPCLMSPPTPPRALRLPCLARELGPPPLSQLEISILYPGGGCCCFRTRRYVLG